MGIFAALRLSGSALQAGRTRMDVIAQNIANVETTRTADGGPYRRRQVVLRTFQVARAPGGARLAGVRVADVEPDPAPLPRLHNPSHPDADLDGYVL
ncbi:MAG: flagellar basal body rod protein FlgC, partial [Armatimonadota bacterium]